MLIPGNFTKYIAFHCVSIFYLLPQFSPRHARITIVFFLFFFNSLFLATFSLYPFLFLSLSLSYTYTLTILLSLPLLSYKQTLFSFTLSQIHTHARAHTEFVSFFFLLPHVSLIDSHYSSLYFCIVYLCRYAGARIEVFPTVFRTRLYMADVRRHKKLAIYSFCIQ